MARPKSEEPTNRELDIFKVLWARGPSTILEVQKELNREKSEKAAYNSVLTVLTIMHTKGFVARDESSRSHVYSAAHSREEIENRLVQRMIKDVFGGSAMRLVARALPTHVASEEEAEEIERLLTTMKGEVDGDP